jgi:hypothetical protein
MVKSSTMGFFRSLSNLTNISEIQEYFGPTELIINSFINKKIKNYYFFLFFLIFLLIIRLSDNQVLFVCTQKTLICYVSKGCKSTKRT